MSDLHHHSTTVPEEKHQSNLSVWLEMPTHAIHLSTHLLRAKVTLPFVLLWGLTSLRIWGSILDALHPLRGTDLLLQPAYPLGISVSPWQPIFTPLDCMRGRPPLSSSCGVWIGADEVSDTDRGRNEPGAKSNEETEQHLWSGSEELWWHTSSGKCLFAVARRAAA